MKQTGRHVGRPVKRHREVGSDGQKGTLYGTKY